MAHKPKYARQEPDVYKRQAQDKQRAAEIPSLIEKIEAARPERSAGVIENRADSAMRCV